MSIPKKPSATIMKANAVPWPDTTRRTIPTATVASHITTPLLSDAPFRCCTPTINQPSARPTAKGHVVEARPAIVDP